MIGHRAGGWPLAAFTAGSLAYILLMGLWPDTMNSLALVAVSVPLAVAVGFGLGVWGFHSARVERFLTPLMDITQTIPAFAYLLPILILFGFGPVAAVIATVIYAMPPMTRITQLSLQRVPQDYLNVAKVLNLSEWKVITRILFPAVLPYMLTGVRLAVGTAWLVIVAAEMLKADGGIGYFIWDAYNAGGDSSSSQIILAILYVGLVGLALDRLVAWAGRAIAKGGN